MTKRIVVVGGGYGGLSFLNRLHAQGRRDLQVTLIDRSANHTVLTEIHEVAAGRRDPATLLLSYQRMSGICFLQAEVIGLDPSGRIVLTSEGPVPFDLLVLAVGSVDTDYGVPGVREHALTLHSMDDALTIRHRINTLAPADHVVIAGGGLTGVELAAEVALSRDEDGNLTIIEAAPTLLPGHGRKMQRGARRRLGTMGVNVVTGTKIERVTEETVATADGAVFPYRLLVWACGVRANPLVSRLGLPVDRSGRAVVGPDLMTAIPGVYALGDCAAGPAPSAQAACQEGTALAEHMLHLLDGITQSVRPVRHQGTLVSLGESVGVGSIGGVQITGVLPAVMKRVNVARWMYKTAGIGAAVRYLVGE